MGRKSRLKKLRREQRTHEEIGTELLMEVCYDANSGEFELFEAESNIEKLLSYHSIYIRYGLGECSRQIYDYVQSNDHGRDNRIRGEDIPEKDKAVFYMIYTFWDDDVRWGFDRSLDKKILMKLSEFLLKIREGYNEDDFSNCTDCTLKKGTQLIVTDRDMNNVKIRNIEKEIDGVSDVIADDAVLKYFDTFGAVHIVGLYYDSENIFSESFIPVFVKPLKDMADTEDMLKEYFEVVKDEDFRDVARRCSYYSIGSLGFGRGEGDFYTADEKFIKLYSELNCATGLSDIVLKASGYIASKGMRAYVEDYKHSTDGPYKVRHILLSSHRMEKLGDGVQREVYSYFQSSERG